MWRGGAGSRGDDAPHGSWGLIPMDAFCMAGSSEQYVSVEESIFKQLPFSLAPS